MSTAFAATVLFLHLLLLGFIVVGHAGVDRQHFEFLIIQLVLCRAQELTRFVLLDEFARDLLEQAVNIRSGLGRHLHKSDVYLIFALAILLEVFLNPLLAFFVGDFAIILVEVTFVSYDVIYALRRCFAATTLLQHPLLLFLPHVCEPISDAVETCSITNIVNHQGNSYAPIIHLDHGPVHLLPRSIPYKQIQTPFIRYLLEHFLKAETDRVGGAVLVEGVLSCADDAGSFADT